MACWQRRKQGLPEIRRLHPPRTLTMLLARSRSILRSWTTSRIRYAAKGGLTSHPMNISVADNPWKSDDAAWFASHPKRSHRLRPLFEEEAATLPAGIKTANIPENHRLEILVRQVQVGARIRVIFVRNVEFPIPDSEEVIHAMFDVVSQPGKQGTAISPDEIAALARKYGGDRSEASH